KIIHSNLGLMGIYTIGPIRGLLDSPLVPDKIPPPEGRIEISLDGSIQEVSLILNDESIIELFSIYSQKPILDRVTTRWNQGWFLSPWAQHMIKFHHRLSVNLLKPNEILAKAGMSPAYAEMAIKIL